MIKLVFILTFAVVLGAAVLGWLGPSATEGFAANAGSMLSDDTSSVCPLSQVALDEGYGVTRVEMRPVCANQ